MFIRSDMTLDSLFWSGRGNWQTLDRVRPAVWDLRGERKQVENSRRLKQDPESKYHAQEEPLLSPRHGPRGHAAMARIALPRTCFLEQHGCSRQQC
jgi:hypothetical protein